MKNLKFLALTLLIAFTFSCSNNDDSPSPENSVTIADFEGSWIASSAVFTNKSNPSENMDFIAEGGEIRYTMLTGGNTRTWIEFQNNPVDEWDALITLGSNNTYTSTPAESTRPIQTGTYTLGNNTITLTNDNTTFDFTLSGNPGVSASVVIIYVPNN